MKRIIVLLLLAAGISAAAQDRYGVVNVSANYMRESPDYTAELGTQNLMGTVVRIVDSDGYWLKVESPEPYTAWITDMGLAEMTETQLKEYMAAPKFIVTAEYSHVFVSPSEKGGRVCDLVMGDILRKTGAKKGKFTGVRLPSGQTGWVRKDAVTDFRSWAGKSRPTADNIVDLALEFVGVPYFWAGTSPKGFDCSGLTRTVFFMNGVLLPRNSSQQAKIGDPVDISKVADGDFSALKKGDLLFFGNRDTGRVTHVAIYMGDNHIVHSSLQVRVNSLRPGDPDYYENSHRLLYARRVIGLEDTGKGITSIINSPAYFEQ